MPDNETTGSISNEIIKPDVEDVREFLRESNGIIVHFSGTPAGVPAPGRSSYPRDLLDVIDNKAQAGLACSVITNADNFDPLNIHRNAIGTIGVIIDLTTPESLLAVGYKDLGSNIINGSRYYPDRSITLSDLEDSLKLRVSYNEWGVKDYTVKGIFAASPYEYWDSSGQGEPKYTDIAEIAKYFPSLPIYTIFNGSFVQVTRPVTSKDIYAEPKAETIKDRFLSVTRACAVISVLGACVSASAAVWNFFSR